jgi:hypothetical protein
VLEEETNNIYLFYKSVYSLGKGKAVIGLINKTGLEGVFTGHMDTPDVYSEVGLLVTPNDIAPPVVNPVPAPPPVVNPGPATPVVVNPAPATPDAECVDCEIPGPTQVADCVDCEPGQKETVGAECVDCKTMRFELDIPTSVEDVTVAIKRK